MSSPIEVFGNLNQLLLSVPLAVFLIVVVAFPAEVFNNTFQENRAQIYGWFHPMRRWFRRVPRLPSLQLPSSIHLAIFALTATALLIIVVPNAGVDTATMAQAIAFLVALSFVVVAFETPAELYARRHSNVATPLRLRGVPLALIVAGFLALLSRLAHFDPPYVYGLIAVYIGAHQALNRQDDKGRGALVGALSVFAVSVTAWIIWIPVNNTIEQGQQGFWLLIADSVLATVFVLGLETVAFGLVPLAFFKGSDLYTWNRAIWATVYVAVAFVFINVQFAARQAKDLTQGEVAKVIALFFIFGIASFVFWAYFRYRTARPVFTLSRMLR